MKCRVETASRRANSFEDALEKLKASKKSLSVLQSEDLSSRLEKYDEILRKETEMQIKLGRLNLELQTKSQELKSMLSLLDDSNRRLTTMKLNVASLEASDNINNIRREMQRLTDEMNSLDAQRLTCWKEK